MSIQISYHASAVTKHKMMQLDFKCEDGKKQLVKAVEEGRAEAPPQKFCVPAHDLS